MGTTNSDEKVTWDNGLSWIDNVLQNIDDYLILNRARGGDDARFEAMQELQQVARLARRSHKYQAVKQKVAELKDHRIQKWGFWGSWGKESFSYKILEETLKHDFSEQDIKLQQTNAVDVAAQEKAMQLTKNDLRLQLAKTDKEKIAALEAIVKEQQILIASHEGRLREISAENDAYKRAQAGFDNTKRRLDLEMNDVRTVVQTERTSAQQVIESRVKLRQQFDAYIKEKETEKQAIEDQHQKVLDELQKKLATAESELNRLREFEKQTKATSEAFKQSQQKMERLQRNQADDKETLQPQLVESKKALDSLSSQITKLKADLKLSEDAYAESQAAMRDLREKHYKELCDKRREFEYSLNLNRETLDQALAKKEGQNVQLKELIKKLITFISPLFTFIPADQKEKYQRELAALETEKNKALTEPSPVVRRKKLATSASIGEQSAIAAANHSPLHAGGSAPTSPAPHSDPTSKASTAKYSL